MKTEGGDNHFPNLRLMLSGGDKGLQGAIEGGDIVARVVLLEKLGVREEGTWRVEGEKGGRCWGGGEVLKMKSRAIRGNAQTENLVGIDLVGIERLLGAFADFEKEQALAEHGQRGFEEGEGGRRDSGGGCQVSESRGKGQTRSETDV